MADKNRMSLREGKVFVDGEQILDLVKCEIYFTPEVVESRSVGQKGKSRRYLGYDITGNISEYKSTPWIKEMIKKYKQTGATPKLTIQGIQDDPNSDYGQAYGSDKVTVVDVVLTGDLPLIMLDSEGELVQNEIEFGAADVIF
jgi:hypothetical protein